MGTKYKLKNKKHLHKLLLLGRDASPIFTEATGMANGGQHHYWIRKNGNGQEEIFCYGSGPGWSDQGCEVYDSYNIEKYLSKLWSYRKSINWYLQNWYQGVWIDPD